MLEFHTHREILRERKRHLTMMFRGEAFGKWLGLDKTIRVEPHDCTLVAF